MRKWYEPKWTLKFYYHNPEVGRFWQLDDWKFYTRRKAEKLARELNNGRLMNSTAVVVRVDR